MCYSVRFLCTGKRYVELKQYDHEKQLLLDMNEKVKEKESKDFEIIKQNFVVDINEVLFDTKICSWKRHNCFLKQHMKEVDHFILLITTDENEVFGIYIKERNGTFFEIRENDICRVEEINQIEWKISDSNKETLIEFGKRKIVIRKQNSELNCYTSSLSHHNQRKENPFKPKRMRIFKVSENLKISNEMNKKFEEEIHQLSQLTLYFKNNPNYEITQIEKYSKSTFEMIIFDSDFCDWSMKSSSFHKKLIGRHNLIIMFETSLNNSFGCFIRNTISESLLVKDPSSFFFSFEKGEFKKFPFNPNYCTIQIGNETDENLIYFENNEVIIKKNGCIIPSSFMIKVKKRYNQFSFIRKEFDVKRVQVIQMEESIEMKQKLLENERIKLRKYSDELKNTKPNKLEQLEKITKTEFLKVLFDSNICDWNCNTSTFGDHLENKQNIIILIQTTNDCFFGGYIPTVISTQEKFISSNGTFLFSFYKNELNIYKQLTKWNMFKINKKSYKELFEFGYKNLVILKNGCGKSNSYQDDQYFDYQQKDFALCGEESFTVKHIQVFQMKIVEEKKSNDKSIEERKEKEHQQLKQLSEEIQQKYSNLLMSIENYTSLEYKELLFDSDCCDWDVGTTFISNELFNKSQLLFIVEIDDNITLGGYFSRKIDNIGNYIYDPNAFIFNYSNDQLEIYEVENKNKAFTLYSKEDIELFEFGRNDLKIIKESRKHYSRSETSEYEMKGKKTLLLTSQKTIFTPKHIQVIQLYESEKIKGKREMKEKQLFISENNQLENLFNKLSDKPTKEMKQIEKYTKMNIVGLLFDSEFCQWNCHSSTFDKHIMNKENLFIEMIDERDLVIGCYINSTIDKYYSDEIDLLKQSSIEDINCTLYILKNENEILDKMEFPINIQYKHHAFQLFDENEQKLFSIGLKDIIIMKQNNKHQCSSMKHFFDYKNSQNIFIGMNSSEKQFTIKSIRVYQLEETENSKEFKKRRKEKIQKIIKKTSEQQSAIRDEATQQTIEDFSKEIKQIEEWSQTTFKETIFDSDVDDWNINTSQFDKYVFGKSLLAFVVEDTERNLFGYYIYNVINRYPYTDNGIRNGQEIIDINSFVFSLRSNGRLMKPMKFDLLKEDRNRGFILTKPHENDLFIVNGGPDIAIKKKHMKSECFCNQKSFDYHGHRNVLVGKEGRNNQFSVKRIQVWQMYETDEQKHQKEKIKEKEKLLQEERVKRMHNEEQLLESKKEQIQTKLKREIKQIENWTKLNYNNIVYDSNLCDMNFDTSTFDLHVLNKNKLAFIIETSNGTKYGGFIFETITSYRTVNEKGYEEGTIDSNAFVFTFKNNTSIKYQKRNEKKNDISFILDREWDNRLFCFGKRDIWIGKKGITGVCIENDPYYNYRGNVNALTGKSGWNNRIEIKRIIVIQFQ